MWTVPVIIALCGIAFYVIGKTRRKQRPEGHDRAARRERDWVSLVSLWRSDGHLLASLRRFRDAGCAPHYRGLLRSCHQRNEALRSVGTSLHREKPIQYRTGVCLK